jgi:uncharacterized protein YceH (UPF0502 family)
VPLVELTQIEARVLGALIEKHMTTPDHYPLTTSSLISACNQTSNRDPVMTLGESEVIEGMDSLRSQGLARTVKRSGERALKHLEIADEGLDISREQKALLAVLLLRGPQTSGELRLRTERYVSLDSLDDADRILESMASADIPVAMLLDRVPGQKESRWMHLLGGATIPDGDISNALEPPAGEPVPSRLELLEAQVVALQERVADLESRLE